ncbi:uncharacterized protein LOC106082162 [Stomoxys calcitrans]|uniref:uncharacterized protein LOC106082162 n=1 Tax=Stomoxys calcitrans TaxID=35570 RepID=UPI0027E341CF|nr:uncharacterized protein LOC106082162 [Stomoxys calcitrans]
MNGTTAFEPVPTKAALALKNKQRTEFKALIFEEPKINRDFELNQPLVTKKNKISNSRPDEDGNAFDIKKARHEVINFAMNNQRIQKNQKKMQIFQMVQLGAKPPKKEHKNYKELLDEKRRLKDIREARKKFHQLGKNQTGAASVKCRSKTKIEKQSKKRVPVSSIDQHYGVARPKLKKKK